MPLLIDLLYILCIMYLIFFLSKEINNNEQASIDLNDLKYTCSNNNIIIWLDNDTYVHVYEYNI